MLKQSSANLSLKSVETCTLSCRSSKPNVKIIYVQIIHGQSLILMYLDLCNFLDKVNAPL